uniref:RRM domain-containing protein n=1 Tax=Glossina brevipalpis TaxID=37001 RepID=A0A1A9W021_9MUSC
MRRRSERKKSTEVSSPAPTQRRTGRRRKSPSVSEDDKIEAGVDSKRENQVKVELDRTTEQDSSDERVESRRRRSSRNRTPVIERCNSLKRTRNSRALSTDATIKSIPEEENGTVNTTDNDESEEKTDHTKIKYENERIDKEDANKEQVSNVTIDCTKENENAVEDKSEEDNTVRTNMKQETSEVEKKTQETPNEQDKEDDRYDQDEVKLHTRDNTPQSRSNSPPAKLSPSKEKSQKDDEPEEGEVVEKPEIVEMDATLQENPNKADREEDKNAKKPSQECEGRSATDRVKDKRPFSRTSSPSKMEEVNHSQDALKTNESSNAAADTGRTRKRRWITKKAAESKEPVLAISTDSLKTLIADVHPVPLSDVQLESSSEVEELVHSEREEGEKSPSPEPERRRETNDKVDKSSKPLAKTQKNQQQYSDKVTALVSGAGVGPVSVQRSPSPARNQTSSVLYITNLVRPFTVLQLKGLLARTGKIVEDGFWIDRIKSKCYVEYETEDEAIETRHALHGVRWPVSNPKCLNVDFGLKSDMLKAVESTKEDCPKFGQDANKDNLLMGTGWSRERPEEEKKGNRPVREWDVGKKENLEREKNTKDAEKRRERSRETDVLRLRETERNERDKERRRRDREREPRSTSLTPVRKQKKKDNDPPLRLLDDLFRKTKATPCIYWLPLTPEQIAEKEALQKKRLEEQKQRLKQRELEREKEREKERNRQSERERDRDRDHRRNRSNDRRRSRSRDRRRY